MQHIWGEMPVQYLLLWITNKLSYAFKWTGLVLLWLYCGSKLLKHRQVYNGPEVQRENTTAIHKDMTAIHKTQQQITKHKAKKQKRCDI